MMKLKPCPFCGCEAKIRSECGNSDRPSMFIVSCMNFDCGATIVKKVCGRGPRPPKGNGIEQLEKKYQLRYNFYKDWCIKQKEDAITAWNRRAEE